jgi:hypothetical protein
MLLALLVQKKLIILSLLKNNLQFQYHRTIKRS